MALDEHDLARRFAALDADRDGEVTWHDFEHRLLTLAGADPAIGSEGLHRVRTGFRALWRSLQSVVDADHDERITFAEYLAYHRASDDGASDAGLAAGNGARPGTGTGTGPGTGTAAGNGTTPGNGALPGNGTGTGPAVGPAADSANVQVFLQAFLDPALTGRYPACDGFALCSDGTPVAFPSELLAGEEVDRYGLEHGTYLAPVGTPVAARAIPPAPGAMTGAAPPGRYHRYTVARCFSVLAGPTAPAFEQSGYGIQYKLTPELLRAAPARVTVGWLVESRYLRRWHGPTG